jgi:organic radical activating enzyme
MKVNEIFYSLQGEGKYTGTAAVFLRLSGCNMKCWFCDTKGHEQGTEMTEEEIAEKVSRYPARHIVITGGEPTMQLNARLTSLLHQKGFFIQIETNGALPLKDGTEVDWVTCSPKGNGIKIQRIDELKLLFLPDFIEKYKDVQAREYSLQMLDEGTSCLPSRAIIDFILANPKWRLSLQTHKLINIQ